MSVEVKTPSPAQFEHVEFPCGQKTMPGKESTTHVEVSEEPKTVEVKVVEKTEPADVTSQKPQDDNFLRPEKQPNQGRKRRASDAANKLPAAKRRFSQSGQRGKQKAPVLPTKFLLGGNINDPLNLNSLCDDEINKALNEVTPQSSPLPTPSHRQQVHVLIPPNIKDPLNLNSGEDIDIGQALLSPKLGAKKKKRHKKRKSAGDVSAVQEELNNSEQNISIAARPDSLSIIIPDGSDATKNVSTKLANVIDQIVSPVIPQTSPKWKRKRTVSECKSEKSTASATTTPVEEVKTLKGPASDRSPQKGKRKMLMSQIGATVQGGGRKFRSKDEQFIYGNYNRYYGKRNPGEDSDHRLQCFHKDWFDHRDVLDIGCNIGHVTLSIAKDFQPKKIVGIDIDGKLISIARKNIRHYISDVTTDTRKFPVSLPITYGPIAAPPLPDEDLTQFPNNVSFVQGNYVLDNDDLLETVREEYDCILALSISKWVHLNNGDAGIKRFFQRAYRQLRPGGKFILEPQSWSSYKKKKKLTETIFRHYQSIRFRPEHFTEYLLSKDVGFITCDLIDLPYNKSKGFQRPIQVYSKPDTSYTTPREVTESRGVTPLMEINCTPHFDCPSYSRNNTPRYDLGYSGYTPGSDRATPSYAMWSSNATPRIDYDSRGATPGHVGGDSRGATPGQHSSSTPGHVGVYDGPGGATPGSHGGGVTPGRGLTPGHEPEGAAAASCQSSSVKNQQGHKYTFVSGDPRGATPAYACDSRGGTPVHSSTSRSGTPVKNVDSEVSTQSADTEIGIQGTDTEVTASGGTEGQDGKNKASEVDKMDTKAHSMDTEVENVDKVHMMATKVEDVGNSTADDLPVNNDAVKLETCLPDSGVKTLSGDGNKSEAKESHSEQSQEALQSTGSSQSDSSKDSEDTQTECASLTVTESCSSKSTDLQSQSSLVDSTASSLTVDTDSSRTLGHSLENAADSSQSASQELAMPSSSSQSASQDLAMPTSSSQSTSSDPGDNSQSQE